MKSVKNNLGYIILGLFVLYFNEILIFNEKFLILLIFVGFILVIRNKFSNDISTFFTNKSKDLLREIFLIEFIIDSKYNFIYFYNTLDLARKKLFLNIYRLYLQSLIFVNIFYYNFIYRQKYTLVVDNLKNLVNDVYYFVLKKYFFIKLNFLYRSYYYIFNKFKVI